MEKFTDMMKKGTVTEAVKPAKFEHGNGYHETFFMQNDDLYNKFVKEVTKFVKSGMSEFDNNEGMTMGKNEKEEAEYILQDIVGNIYNDVKKKAKF